MSHRAARSRRLAGIFGTTEQKERIREELGLNDPIHTQYLRWISGVFSGDFGEMIVMAPGTPIAEMLRKAAARHVSG